MRADGIHILRRLRVLPLRAGDWRKLRELSLEIVREESEIFREDRNAVFSKTAGGRRTLAQGRAHPANDYLCGWLGQ